MRSLHKPILLALLVSVSLCSFACAKDEAAVEKAAPAEEAKEEAKPKAEEGVLTDEQIASLKTEWTSPETKKVYKLGSCWLRPERPKTAVQMMKHKKNGTVPVRICYALYEIKELGGRKRSIRQTGQCHLLVKNAEGKVVIKQTADLSKMCPS